MARPIEKRQHLERGVVEVVAEKGLHATTIQDIADAAGVSPGLLYRYWKNRDELAADVYRAHFTQLMRRLTALVAAESDVRRKIAVMIRAFLEFADQQPVLLKFLLLSQHDLSRSIPREQGLRALVGRIIQEGIAQRRIRNMDADLALQFLIGIVLQPAVGAIYGDLSRPVSNHYAEIMSAVRRTLFRDGKADPDPTQNQ